MQKSHFSLLASLFLLVVSLFDTSSSSRLARQTKIDDFSKENGIFQRFLSISLILAVLYPMLIFTNVSAITISDETKKQIESTADKAQEAAAPALDKTFQARKEVITLAVDAALLAVQAWENRVKNSPLLTSEQKNELLPIVQNMQKSLEDYKASVKAATTSDELYAANKAFLKAIAANKEQIKAAAATVMMMGVEASIAAAKLFYDTAQKSSNALKVCGLDTKEANDLITKGLGMLKEMEDLYNKIMADKKVSPEEQADVKKAARLSASISANMAEITLVLSDLSLKCPALN